MSKKEKKKITKLPEMKTLELVKDGLRLSDYLSKAIRDGSFRYEKAHYWATYVVHCLKNAPEITAYQEHIKKLDGHDDYTTAVRTNMGKRQSQEDWIKENEKIEKKFKALIEKRNELQDEPLGLRVRPFLTDWVKKSGVSKEISSLLIDFELLDNPESLIDYLYNEE